MDSVLDDWRPSNSPEPPFPFLALPIELRFKIYWELLYHDYRLNCSGSTDPLYRVYESEDDFNCDKDNILEDTLALRTGFEVIEGGEELETQQKDIRSEGDFKHGDTNSILGHQTYSRLGSQNVGGHLQMIHTRWRPWRGNRHRIHPTILRVNRQVYREALPTLYKHTKCKIKFYRKALRQDFHCCFVKEGRNPWRWNNWIGGLGSLFRSWESGYHGDPPIQKVMNLHCLHHFFHIKIDSSWGWMLAELPHCGGFIFHDLHWKVGAMALIQTLRYLNEEPTPLGSIRKTLLVCFDGEKGLLLETLMAECGLIAPPLPADSHDPMIEDGARAEVAEILIEIIELLIIIRKRRRVLVTEEWLPPDGSYRICRYQIDLDTLPEFIV